MEVVAEAAAGATKAAGDDHFVAADEETYNDPTKAEDANPVVTWVIDWYANLALIVPDLTFRLPVPHLTSPDLT